MVIKKGKIALYKEKMEAEVKAKASIKSKYNVDKAKAGKFDSFFEQQVFDNLKRMQEHFDFDFSYHLVDENIHWYTFNKWNKRYEFIGLTRDDICNDKIHHLYEPDFVVILRNGKKFYIESKGWLPSEDRTKMKNVKKLNPDLDIRFMFQKKQNLKINNNQTNIEWALKNGFDKSIIGGLLPKSWFE